MQITSYNEKETQKGVIVIYYHRIFQNDIKKDTKWQIKVKETLSTSNNINTKKSTLMLYNKTSDNQRKNKILKTARNRHLSINIVTSRLGAGISRNDWSQKKVELYL